MAWIVLIVSGMLEAVWATALEASDGLRRHRAVIVFVIAATVSIGATLTVVWGMVTGKETATTLRVLLLVVLIGSVVGLKAVS